MTAVSLSEEDIFQIARRIDVAEARQAYLDQVCHDNAPLREQVDVLLACFNSSAGFLESPAPEIASVLPIRDQSISEQRGDAIGPYKLLDQIGEGGFGVVFLAEQEKPVRRRVALKVVKPGMDTRDVVARFEAERQALALMDHQNIARVYKAGATDSGRPYFVMELVQGVPITEYCDQCQLTTRKRLELFVTVCQAVQHAHQKGIIHRDLKPNNVLVAMQDGKAAPKIIDFGVAKAIGEQTLTERTLTTAFAQMVGTPLYMSPEQAELSPLGVDTRSDIYSLGVMLYELLAGTTPFAKDRLYAASYDELRRIIREEEPPRPSARISTLAADLATTIAERRRTDAARLQHVVRGELDWIVMKCLEKDRSRRYESAGGLAQEVERYLADEPVQACPPSTSYCFRKFARRNKGLLASAGTIAATLIVGFGVSMWMYVRATTERARAESVNDFLKELLAHSDADREVEAVILGLAHGINLDNERASQFVGEPEAQAELAASYAWLANFLATAGRQEEGKSVVRMAAEHLAQASIRDLPPKGRLKALWHLAVASLRLGDQGGYHEACAAMLHVPTDNDDDQLLVLWMWCLGPHPGDDISVKIKQAEKLAARHAASNYVGSFSAPWIDLGRVGGLLYRAGQYEQAAHRLEESLAAYPDDALCEYRTDLDCQLLLAMAKWQLGGRDDARRLLAEIQPAINEWLQDPSNTWMRRAEIEVLRREAEALIEPK